MEKRKKFFKSGFVLWAWDWKLAQVAPIFTTGMWCRGLYSCANKLCGEGNFIVKLTYIFARNLSLEKRRSSKMIQQKLIITFIVPVFLDGARIAERLLCSC